MNEPLPITNRLAIPAADLSYEFSRSGGPGGQHVNTTDTRVRMRFALDRCGALYDSAKARIREQEGNRITVDGELVITSDRFRSRHRNVLDVRERLAEIVRRCLKPPKKRRATKPSRSAKKKRMDKKNQRGKTKKLRGRVRED